MDKGISGFQAAGIWPINPEKFSEDDFGPNPENDIMLDHSQVNLDDETEENDTNKKDKDPSEPQPEPQKDCDNLEPQPGPSRDCVVNAHSPPRLSLSQDSLVPIITNNSPLRKQLEILSPVPRPAGKAIVQKKAKKHSEILTSTPLKEQLEAAKEKKIQKKGPIGVKTRTEKIKQTKKRKLSLNKNIPKPRHVRNLQLGSDSDSSASSYDEKKLCDDNEDDDVDPFNTDVCIVCGEFGKNREIWYRCVICANWTHAECSGWDSAEEYTCDLCLSKNKKLKRQ